MGWLNHTGLETGDTSDFNDTGGTYSIQSTVVHKGNYALRVNPTGAGTGFTSLRSPAMNELNVTNLYCRFYFRYATKPASAAEQIIRVNSGGGGKFQLRLNSSGKIQAHDNNTFLLGTTTTVLSANTWYRIDFLAGTGVSAPWAVRINGTVDISGTGNLSIGLADSVSFGKVVNANSQTIDVYYDDIAIRDDTYPADGQVTRMDINGDGSSSAWTIGAGSGADYLQVDDTPPDDNTTYLLSTLTMGAVSLFSLESSSQASVSGTINATKIIARAVRDGSTNSSFKIRYKSGATTADSSAITCGTQWKGWGLVRTTDPNTGAAWTTAGLDALEIGGVNNSTGSQTRVTHFSLMVDHLVTNLLTQTLAGSITPTGALAKKAKKTLTASTTGVGSLTKKAKKTLTASTTGVGSLTKKAKKTLTASITGAGAVTNSLKATLRKSLSGSITPVGTLTRVVRVWIYRLTLTGSITPVGTLTKRVRKTLAGAVTAAGSLLAGIAQELRRTDVRFRGGDNDVSLASPEHDVAINLR